jgi:hypothetical protein
MLRLAFALLCAAASLGAGLAVRYLRGPHAKPLPAAIPAAHGVLGAASLGALLLALLHGLPRTGMGTAGFAPIAAGLLALALAFGLTLAWRRGRPPAPVLVATHASVAIAGLVILLALVALC